MDSEGKGTGLAKPKVQTGYLSLRETMKYLDVSKSEIERFVKSRRLTAYKLGGSHLRFRKDQLLILKHELDHHEENQTFVNTEKIEQFWAFNSFYIVTGALLSGVLLYFLKA